MPLCHDLTNNQFERNAVKSFAPADLLWTLDWLCFSMFFFVPDDANSNIEVTLWNNHSTWKAAVECWNWVYTIHTYDSCYSYIHYSTSKKQIFFHLSNYSLWSAIQNPFIFVHSVYFQLSCTKTAGENWRVFWTF